MILYRCRYVKLESSRNILLASQWEIEKLSECIYHLFVMMLQMAILSWYPVSILLKGIFFDNNTLYIEKGSLDHVVL